METKEFNMDHVTDKVSNITIALFNCCQEIKTDSEGRYVWKAVGLNKETNSVVCIKERD